MIEIGGDPILVHIMKVYSAYGFNEFIICAGYKQHVIKEYFADYFLHTSDITYDFTNGKNEMTIHRMADQIPNLIYCGRLADFQYYNMDQALDRALSVCAMLDSE